jgi:A/G-specific adenine glycosylase
MNNHSFALRLIRWQRQYGRHDLPWQGGDAYRVWLSEIMLQQTQVVTVVPYFLRFVDRFPDVAALAAATEDQVLALWSGLGYYARGRNLHRAAQQLMSQFGGLFPDQFERLQELPGIGRSTAAAICALAFHQRRAILDGNVKRVLSRHGAIEGWPGERGVEAALWQLAEARLPDTEVAVYTQALMDLGATLCRRSKPRCSDCPVAADCAALRTDRVSDFPAPRPKRALPERRAVFLLAMHEHDILLEKCPPTGLWGGLWSLPQFDSVTEALAYCECAGIEVGVTLNLAGLVHTFSHFRLHIQPLLVHGLNKPQQVAEVGKCWLATDAALQAAIPAPVRQLLLSMSAGRAGAGYRQPASASPLARPGLI